MDYSNLRQLTLSQFKLFFNHTQDMVGVKTTTHIVMSLLSEMIEVTSDTPPGVTRECLRRLDLSYLELPSASVLLVMKSLCHNKGI